MWMTMGCNDDGEICLPTNSDSFSSGGKLRPLIPRPPPNPNTNSPNHHQHQLHHYQGSGIRDPNHSFFALNHPHLEMMQEQSKGEFNAVHRVVVSSRWNPTPEQLQALEDLYRSGTRTPSADQIQQITSQLRRYGKIEGKNVFYWFQNHKARERQKRRRQMESRCRAEEENGHLNNLHETGNLECKESDTGGSRNTASDDVQRANSNNSYNWGSAEGSNIDRGGRSAMAAGGGGSASASSSAAAAVKTTSTSPSTAFVTSLYTKLNDTTRELLLPNPNIVTTTNTSSIDDNFDVRRNATCRHLVHPPRPVLLPTSAGAGHTVRTAFRLSSPPLPLPSQDLQTLRLFPLRREEEDFYDEGFEKERDRVDFASACCAGEDDHRHCQFFEFLPLKN